MLGIKPLRVLENGLLLFRVLPLRAQLGGDMSKTGPIILICCLLTACAASAPPAANPPSSEYGSEFSYRLSYTVRAKSGESIADVPCATAAPGSLAEDSGCFLQHKVNLPAPVAANGSRALVAAEQDEAEEENFEHWVRFRREKFTGAAFAMRRQAVNPQEPCETTEIAEAHSARDAWDNAYRMIAVHGRCPDAKILANLADGRSRELQLIEPKIPSELANDEEDRSRDIKEKSARSWPFPQYDPDPKKNEAAAEFWHRRPEYTGLDAAFDQVRPRFVNTPKGPSGTIVVAHLDTGYPDVGQTQFAGYPLPLNLDRDISADCYEPFLKDSAASPRETPCLRGNGAGIDISDQDPTFNKTSWFLTNYLHGAGTLAILAGGPMEKENKSCLAANARFFGANPCAKILEIRVGQSFVHFNEESMAAGIYYAVDSGADVISISHGGAPAGVLESAVNHAYKHGAAVFAASGDFLGTWLISTPKTVVFPARYGQVMDVTGATSDGRSAGDHCTLLFCIWDFGGGNGFGQNFLDWLIGTNFGPAGIMQNHSVAAYTPNITMYSASLGGVSNDELGTSAATPQAAAAASLWLEYYKDQIVADGVSHPIRHKGGGQNEDIWRSWRKSEAVYQAMMKSAKWRVANLSDADSQAYSRQYFGSGVLDAGAMLQKSYDEVRPSYCEKRHKSHADLFWWADAIASLSIFDAIGWSTPDEAHKAHDVSTAFANASRIELMQLAYRSPDLASALADMSEEISPSGDASHCANPNNDLTKVKAAEWEKVRSYVHQDDHASETIKRLVAALAKNNA
jgi:hypothetical protein